jgi:hypothetical protein
MAQLPSVSSSIYRMQYKLGRLATDGPGSYGVARECGLSAPDRRSRTTLPPGGCWWTLGIPRLPRCNR